jgi:hypothetical protein
MWIGRFSNWGFTQYHDLERCPLGLSNLDKNSLLVGMQLCGFSITIQGLKIGKKQGIVKWNPVRSLKRAIK